MKGKGIFGDVLNFASDALKTGAKYAYHGVSKLIDPNSTKEVNEIHAL